MQRLPNLICPGAMKSGTTTLFDIVKQHPDIFVPAKKELHFFSDAYEKGLKYYSKYFKDAGSQKYRIDITPYYMFPETVPGRIFESCGKDVKFIFILRNPVDRAYSMHFMRKNMLVESKSFEKAIGLEEKRISKNSTFQRRYSYISRGYYYAQIKKFLDYYPIENMHFIIFERFTEDMEGETRRLFRFLNIDENVIINYDVWANKPMKYKNDRLYNLFKKTVKGAMLLPYRLLKKIIGEKSVKKIRNTLTTQEENKNYPVKNIRTCKTLMKQYVDDIHKLEELTGEDLAFWIRKYL